MLSKTLGECALFYVCFNSFEIIRSQSLKVLKSYQNNEVTSIKKLLGVAIVIVITFYSPSCLGQEIAKGPFGLRVQLPPAHLSTTHDGGFTLSL